MLHPMHLSPVPYLMCCVRYARKDTVQGRVTQVPIVLPIVGVPCSDALGPLSGCAKVDKLLRPALVALMNPFLKGLCNVSTPR